MKDRMGRYKLLEVGDPAGGGRRFLYNCENDHIAELSKVVDETAGREAIVLNRSIPYDVRRRLFGFCTDDYMVDHDALAPSPIWNYHSLERIRTIPLSSFESCPIRLSRTVSSGCCRGCHFRPPSGVAGGRSGRLRP